MTTVPGHLPPSAKLVSKVLAAADEPLTWRDLRLESELAKTTLAEALSALDDAGALNSRPNPLDLRQTLYWLDGDSAGYRSETGD